MSIDSSRLVAIGSIVADDHGVAVLVKPEFNAGLLGLSKFSHAHILWWAHQCESPQERQELICKRPYTHSPDDVGVFGCRSPKRPNPMGLSVVPILQVNREEGLIRIPYVDAEPGTPVIDIKPYFNALDRVETATGPDWCRHWPQSYEASADFDWDREFTDA